MSATRPPGSQWSSNTAQALTHCCSKRSEDMHDSGTATSLPVALMTKISLTQRSRTLRETLEDFRGDSDAPPALRCLAAFPAVDVKNKSFNDDEDGHHHHHHHHHEHHHSERDEGVGEDEDEVTTDVIGGSATAPPTPHEPHEPHKRTSSGTTGIGELDHILCHGSAESSLSQDASNDDNANGDLHALEDMSGVRLRDLPLFFPTTTQSFFWHSYSGPSTACDTVGRLRGGELSTSANTEAPLHGSGEGRQPAHELPSNAGGGKKGDAALESREGGGGGGLGRGANDKIGAAVHICPDSVHLFKRLGLLKPVLFAASYPRGKAPSRSGNVTGEIPGVDRIVRKGGFTKLDGGMTKLSSETGRVKLSSAREMQHYRIRTRGSESCFSLSTPRRQSTSSMQYSANFQTSRIPFMRNPQVQQQGHSRIYSFSRASSDKAPCSPTTSGAFRQRPSDSLERFQQHRIIQQTHLYHLPAFTSGGASWESTEHGVGMLATWHGSRVCGTNSVSSLLLTRTTSNIDTLPTCCDAPLDPFMESSCFAESSTSTAHT